MGRGSRRRIWGGRGEVCCCCACAGPVEVPEASHSLHSCWPPLSWQSTAPSIDAANVSVIRVVSHYIKRCHLGYGEHSFKIKCFLDEDKRDQLSCISH